MKKHFKLIRLSALLLLLDQLSKYVFYNQKLFADRWFFRPVFNTWVSRSVQIPIVFTILIAAIALGVFLIAYQRKYFTAIVFAILLAGTLWNLIDRIALSGVRDFLWIWSRFPIFNLADIYLNIGVLLFIIPQLFAWKEKVKS
jgi:signal peptidase II